MRLHSPARLLQAGRRTVIVGTVGLGFGLLLVTGTAAAAPTISAYAIPGSGPSDTISIAPAAAGAQDEWVIDTAQASAGNLIGAATLYSLPATGGGPGAIANLDVQNSGGFGNSFNGGAGVLVNAGGDDYAASLNGTLIGLGAGGATTSTQISNLGQGQLVVGTDDSFYAGEGERGIDATLIQGTNPLPKDYSLPSVYASGTGGGGVSSLAIDASGDIWFATESGQLGCLDPSSGAFSDPYATSEASGAVSLSGLPGTLALDGGTIYAVTAANNAIAAISTVNPNNASVYAAPAGATINGLTVGPDGNVWFADTANNAIGELNATTGTVNEYSLPSGVTLPAFDLGNSTTIAPGPSGSGAVFFQALEGGGAVVGVLNTGDGGSATTSPVATSCPGPIATATTTGSGSTGVTHPTPTKALAGKLTVARTARVSGKGQVALGLTCSGAACAGKLTLTVATTEKVKGETRRVTRIVAVARYALTRGRSKTLRVTLTEHGLAAVHAAKRQRLAARVVIAPSKAAKSTVKVELAA